MIKVVTNILLFQFQHTMLITHTTNHTIFQTDDLYLINVNVPQSSVQLCRDEFAQHPPPDPIGNRTHDLKMRTTLATRPQRYLTSTVTIFRFRFTIFRFRFTIFRFRFKALTQRLPATQTTFCFEIFSKRMTSDS